jgi:hypothetical protein
LALGTNIWTTSGGKASTYISLFNHFSFAIFFHTSCLLSVFEQRICTCVIQICLTPCFVLFLGLGQEAQQVVCRGLLAWGSKHIYFLIHTNCDLFFSCLFPCYVSVTSFSYLILSYQVFCHLICIIMCHFCCYLFYVFSELCFLCVFYHVTCFCGLQNKSTHTMVALF